MFYIVEVIKGKPEKNIKGLRFAKCSIYDYFICGDKTPTVGVNYTHGDKTNRWDAYNQQYSLDDFFKQYEEISKRKGYSEFEKIDIQLEAQSCQE